VLALLATLAGAPAAMGLSVLLVSTLIPAAAYMIFRRVTAHTQQGDDT